MDVDEGAEFVLRRHRGCRPRRSVRSGYPHQQHCLASWYRGQVLGSGDWPGISMEISGHARWIGLPPPESNAMLS